MKFDDKYNSIKELCKNQLSEIDNIMISSIILREEFNQYVINFLTLPAKRIRPLLSILYMNALGLNISSEQLEILAAVELIHNASLIHDDVIDESDMRRGQKTLSCRFGNKLGVICGDYLLSVAMNILCKLGSVNIINNFTNTLNKMCIGEVNQHFDKFKIGSLDDYIEKSKNKTAYLFQSAMMSPLLYSSAPDEVILKSSDFGLNFGIAFQMRDDIINITSSDSSKPSKNDISEGIYSASVIYAGSVENHINGLEKAHCLLNNYVDKTEAAIANFPVNKYTLALRELLELLKYEI